MELRWNDYNPRILFYTHFNGYEISSHDMAKRTCYDYEMEYYIKSDGGVLVENNFIKFKPGDIGFRRPGQLVQGVGPYECILLCFDLKGNRCLPQNYNLGSALYAQENYKNELLDLIDSKMQLKQNHYIYAQMLEIGHLLTKHTSFNILKANTILATILLACIEEKYQSIHEQSKMDKHVQRALDYIYQNYTQQITISDFYEEYGISKAYFNRKFKECTHTLPKELITSLRMNKAKNLLAISTMKIETVAELCGYNDSAYFGCLFKKLFGMTPLTFRLNSLQ